MPITTFADVIVPDIFNPYLIQRQVEVSRIIRSGIAATVPGLAFPDGGRTLNMPFWSDLTGGGGSEVLPSNGVDKLTPQKITGKKDIAAVHTRGKAWSSNDLAGVFAGSDPMMAIADQVADFWSKDDQDVLLATLKGIFAAASMQDNLLDKSSAVIDKKSLIEAMSLLGDRGDTLTGIICHSAVMYYLAAAEILDKKIDADNPRNAPELSRFLGRELITDDTSPFDKGTGVYTTYLFGAGAIGIANGTPPVPTETERDALAGVDRLINRRHYILHPRGVAWKGSPAGSTPTNDELAVGTNWERVYDPKNIRIVAIKHKIGA